MTIIASDRTSGITPGVDHRPGQLGGQKFCNPNTTATGEARATVALNSLTTLWFNTGTLCNLACASCYIESSPANDALVYLSRRDVAQYLQEIADTQLPVQEIGITGGEPFMNPDIMDILNDCLAAGYRTLILTNAMRPMEKRAQALLALQRQFPGQLELRISIDHYTQRQHELERGNRAWAPMLRGLQWLAHHGFNISIAGRLTADEAEGDLRQGYSALFQALSLPLNAQDPQALTLFPHMDSTADVPEITTACWATLGVDPATMMCASARMVVKHKGHMQPTVVACTLLPYAKDFNFSQSLAHSMAPVALNHPHCATFCVLGGASCSG